MQLSKGGFVAGTGEHVRADVVAKVRLRSSSPLHLGDNRTYEKYTATFFSGTGFELGETSVWERDYDSREEAYEVISGLVEQITGIKPSEKDFIPLR